MHRGGHRCSLAPGDRRHSVPLLLYLLVCPEGALWNGSFASRMWLGASEKLQAPARA